MANIKFSDFTANATIVQADHFLVGFDDDDRNGGANPKNNKWTFSEVAVGLAAVTATPYSIYAADGTIGTTRKALITDTIQFRNAGDTSDVFTLNTDGTFALGLGAAAAGGYTAVAMGNAAAAANSYSISIGSSSDTSATYAIAIGGGATGAQATGQDSIAIGGNAATAAGAFSTAIGYSAITAGDHSINIGRKSRGSADNAITLNASTDAVAPNTANAFGVYMSSNTTPDFQINHDGNSYITGSGKFGIGKSNPLATLDIVHYDATRKLASFNNASAAEVFSIENNGTVKITGQAYTELHTNATNLVVSWNDSNIQTVTVNTSVPVFAPTNPKAGATYILIIEQGATPVTVDWNSLVKWPGGTAPTLSSVTGKIDVITLICYDEGNNYYYGSATLDLA